jgi:hypothetical protein
MVDMIKVPTKVVLEDESGFANRPWFRFFTLLAARCGIIDGSTSTSATTGAASGLPANPAGYLTITKDGKDYKVPYYNI